MTLWKPTWKIPQRWWEHDVWWSRQLHRSSSAWTSFWESPRLCRGNLDWSSGNSLEPMAGCCASKPSYTGHLKGQEFSEAKLLKLQVRQLKTSKSRKLNKSTEFTGTPQPHRRFTKEQRTCAFVQCGSQWIGKKSTSGHYKTSMVFCPGIAFLPLCFWGV